MVSLHEKMRTEIQKAARQDNVLAQTANQEMYKITAEMRDMSLRMIEDTTSMKAITFVAFLYLPATLIVVSLSPSLSRFAALHV